MSALFLDRGLWAGSEESGGMDHALLPFPVETRKVNPKIFVEGEFSKIPDAFLDLFYNAKTLAVTGAFSGAGDDFSVSWELERGMRLYQDGASDLWTGDAVTARDVAFGLDRSGWVGVHESEGHYFGFFLSSVPRYVESEGRTGWGLLLTAQWEIFAEDGIAGALYGVAVASQEIGGGGSIIGVPLRYAPVSDFSAIFRPRFDDVNSDDSDFFLLGGGGSSDVSSAIEVSVFSRFSD